MPSISTCVKVLQECLTDLQAEQTQNAAEQAEVTAALKALGATPGTAEPEVEAEANG